MICDQCIALNGHYSAKAYPEQLRRIRFKDPQSGKTLVFLTNNGIAGFDHRHTVQEPLAEGVVLQVDQAASAHQALYRQ